MNQLLWTRVALPVIVSILFGLVAAGAIASDLGEVQNFATDPVAPTTYQPTSILLDGIWNNGCVPKLLGVNVTAGHVSIGVHSPQQICTQAFTSWSLEVPVGLLPAGTYTASVQHYPRGELGSFVFDVSDAVGTSLHGVTPRKTACVNLTTKQRVVVRGTRSPVNCEAAGLPVHPGDEIVIRSFGTMSVAP